MVGLSYSLMLLLTVVQIVTYYLYNGRFHPFALIILPEQGKVPISIFSKSNFFSLKVHQLILQIIQNTQKKMSMQAMNQPSRLTPNGQRTCRTQMTSFTTTTVTLTRTTVWRTLILMFLHFLYLLNVRDLLDLSSSLNKTNLRKKAYT